MLTPPSTSNSPSRADPYILRSLGCLLRSKQGQLRQMPLLLASVIGRPYISWGIYLSVLGCVLEDRGNHNFSYIISFFHLFLRNCALTLLCSQPSPSLSTKEYFCLSLYPLIQMDLGEPLIFQLFLRIENEENKWLLIWICSYTLLIFKMKKKKPNPKIPHEK